MISLQCPVFDIIPLLLFLKRVPWVLLYVHARYPASSSLTFVWWVMDG
jgi:hypothetical protein